MNKTLIFASAAAVMLGFAACDNKGNVNRTNIGDNDREEVYTGVMPAADVAGIRYTLRLDFDDDHNFTDGDYDLYETYLVDDTTATLGYRDIKTYRTEGDFTVETGIPSNPQAKYIKLVPKSKKSTPGTPAEPVYFEISSDSTLTMLNSQLEPPADSGLDYILKMK